jgi:hypothetical protein
MAATNSALKNRSQGLDRLHHAADSQAPQVSRPARLRRRLAMCGKQTDKQIRVLVAIEADFYVCRSQSKLIHDCCVVHANGSSAFLLNQMARSKTEVFQKQYISCAGN